MNANEATIRLCTARGAAKTVCPSEVARFLAAHLADTGKDGQKDGRWREAMPLVHRAVDLLVSEGLIVLSWKGQTMTRRTGPYRIRLNLAASPISDDKVSKK